MVENKQVARERRTMELMIQLYCQENHGVLGGLCQSCRALCDYAMTRLEGCVFKADKPTCVNCPVHCYKKDKREQVRIVMKYSGPRMLLRHPLLALWHLLDGKKKAPGNGRQKSAADLPD